MGDPAYRVQVEDDLPWWRLHLFQCHLVVVVVEGCEVIGGRGQAKAAGQIRLQDGHPCCVQADVSLQAGTRKER